MLERIEKSKTRQILGYLTLFLIILLGFYWRYLLILKDDSFIFDEGWDFIQANSFQAGEFLKGEYWDVPLHPPLHYLFLLFW